MQRVCAEDRSRTPISDGDIAQSLGQQGMMAARRTIANCRESLHVSPVNLRASL
jgi:RNA polymerase sigma-54 factor